MRKTKTKKRNPATKRKFNIIDWLPLLIKLALWLSGDGDGGACPTN